MNVDVVVRNIFVVVVFYTNLHRCFNCLRFVVVVIILLLLLLL